MKTFASEMVAKYGLSRAKTKDGDKIYTRTMISGNKKQIMTLEQLYGCKECILKVRTYYKSGKIENNFMFGLVDDVFNKGGLDYEDNQWQL